MMSTRLNMEVKKPRQVLYLILIVAVLFRVVAAFYMGDEVTGVARYSGPDFL